MTAVGIPPPAGDDHIEGVPVAVVVGEEAMGQPDLLQIVHASDALGLRFGFRERRQEQAGQNGDDGDNDEQLNERKTRRSEFTNMCHNFSVIVWVKARAL